MMNILCVCQGNTSVSPMVEKIAQIALGSKHNVESCGVHEKAKNSSKASLSSIATVARNLPGHSIEDHKSRHVMHVELGRFHHILCASQAEADIVVGMGVLAKKIHVLEIASPEQEGLLAYQKCFEDIINKVQKWVDAT